MHQYSKLRPLSKLDQLAETIMKTAFILSENHHVTQSYLNHKGSHFKVKDKVIGEEFEVLCRQINIEKTNYTFINKNHLDLGLRDDLYVGLVIFIDNEKPKKFIFPSTVWNKPTQLFTDSTNKEYGINLNSRTFEDLKQYAFETIINRP